MDVDAEYSRKPCHEFCPPKIVFIYVQGLTDDLQILPKIGLQWIKIENTLTSNKVESISSIRLLLNCVYV